MTAAEIEKLAEGPVASRSEHLVAVVGFDGSEPSFRALDAATLLIAGRVGTLEIVWVAHPAAGTEMSGSALGESLGFRAGGTGVSGCGPGPPPRRRSPMALPTPRQHRGPRAHRGREAAPARLRRRRERPDRRRQCHARPPPRCRLRPGRAGSARGIPGGRRAVIGAELLLTSSGPRAEVPSGRARAGASVASGAHAHTRRRESSAERGGFEPPDPVSQVNSLAVSPIRPLSHLSWCFSPITALSPPGGTAPSTRYRIGRRDRSGSLSPPGVRRLRSPDRKPSPARAHRAHRRQQGRWAVSR